ERATDQRIDLAGLGKLVEVDGVRVERTCRLLLAVAIVLGGFLLLVLFRRSLRDAVGDVVDNIETGDAALIQEVDGMGLFLTEDRDQDVGAGDLLLAR